MSRCFCFVLCLMLFFSTTTIADTTEEIRFRGIEWGADYHTAMTAFDDNIVWKQPKASSVSSIEYMMTEILKNKKYYSEPVACIVSTKFFYNNLEVAGYPVTESSLYFAYTPNENGEYNQVLDQTALYFANYKFVSFKDHDAANIDLVNKLTQLYGEPSTTIIQEQTDYPDEFRQWNGANNTSCVLTRSYTSDYDITEIRYGWMDGEQLLSEAFTYYSAIAAAEEAAAAKAAGTDGL